MTRLGDFLKEVRESRGLGLRAAGRLIGISGMHLSRLESGEDQKPSVETLVRLADAYGVDLGNLAELAAEPHIKEASRLSRVG